MMNKKFYILMPALLAVLVAIAYSIWPETADTIGRQMPLNKDAGSHAPQGDSAYLNKDVAVQAEVADSFPAAATSDEAYSAVLEELKITTGNPLIEYVYSEDGKLLKEIDNDPGSLSFKKPLKIYKYTDDKVTTLTRYQYYEHETVKTTLDVAYAPDGTVMDYRESVNQFRP